MRSMKEAALHVPILIHMNALAKQRRLKLTVNIPFPYSSEPKRGGGEIENREF